MTPSARRQAIEVRYVYSACVVTTTPDLRILHDPWFTEGVYDGSWYHHPKVVDPIGSIGDVDLVYVSHLHPDHYDPAFLRQYFAVHGEKEIVVAEHAPNHLANKMRVDGFKPTVLREPRQVGNTRVQVLAHKTGSASDIDSAIVLHHDDGQRRHCVVNANDIIFDAATTQALKAAAGDVDILLCGYTGAGPYPQTYFELNDPRLPAEADNKRQAFFERYRKLTTAIGARMNLPFAGKYMLGGRLTALNGVRGVADPTEVLAFDPRAVVLADNGGTVATDDLKPSAVRREPYDPALVRQREAEISGLPMDYERLMPLSEVHQLPLKRLIGMASRKAHERSECDSDYFFVVHLPGDQWALLNANRHGDPAPRFGRLGDALPEPRSEITIDPRHLFGLLTHVYHWNNAEVGSQYATRRVPNQLNRQAQYYLNFLAV